LSDLPPKVAGGSEESANALRDVVERRVSLEQLEHEYVRAVLESVNGNKTEAAAILRIDRKTLYRKLEEPEPIEPVPLSKP
jgi:DNA-binding NtrC family response regulator